MNRATAIIERREADIDVRRREPLRRVVDLNHSYHRGDGDRRADYGVEDGALLGRRLLKGGLLVERGECAHRDRCSAENARGGSLEAQRQRHGEDWRSSCAEAEAYEFRVDRETARRRVVARRVRVGRRGGYVRIEGCRRGEKEWSGRRWRII